MTPSEDGDRESFGVSADAGGAASRCRESGATDESVETESAVSGRPQTEVPARALPTGRLQVWRTYYSPQGGCQRLLPVMPRPTRQPSALGHAGGTRDELEAAKYPKGGSPPCGGGAALKKFFVSRRSRVRGAPPD
ncbi:hypothetical protein GQ600_20937 [Phytophthora cactorum]|nr:hypothetical protein GQ600_20937 [Phytophthora cactorum]